MNNADFIGMMRDIVTVFQQRRIIQEHAYLAVVEIHKDNASRKKLEEYRTTGEMERRTLLEGLQDKFDSDGNVFDLLKEYKKNEVTNE